MEPRKIRCFIQADLKRQGSTISVHTIPSHLGSYWAPWKTTTQEGSRFEKTKTKVHLIWSLQEPVSGRISWGQSVLTECVATKYLISATFICCPCQFIFILDFYLFFYCGTTNWSSWRWNMNSHFTSNQEGWGKKVGKI